jgi:hypothetical protein
MVPNASVEELSGFAALTFWWSWKDNGNCSSARRVLII